MALKKQSLDSSQSVPTVRSKQKYYLTYLLVLLLASLVLLSINMSSSAVPFLKYTQDDFILSPPVNSTGAETENDKVKQKLMSAWKCAQKKGILNYSLGDCKSKLVEGKYGVSLQINKDRSRKRRSPEQFHSICQPFDETKWNFTRLKEDECLFRMVRLDRRGTLDDDSTIIAVNASPINFGHSLVVPSPAKRLPQVITSAAICDGLELLCLVSDPNFVLIFNGLLAHASVNHLHFHSIFWPFPSGIVSKKTEMLLSTPFSIIRRPNWFVPAFVFQLNERGDIEFLAKSIEKAVHFLISSDLSYNLFFARAHKFNSELAASVDHLAPQQNFLPTVYLFARRKTYGGLCADCLTFIPAGLELAGLIPIYDNDFCNSTNEQQIIEVIDGYSLIEDELFEKLVGGMTEHLKEKIIF